MHQDGNDEVEKGADSFFDAVIEEQRELLRLYASLRNY
jgi:hypothetical protein